MEKMQFFENDFDCFHTRHQRTRESNQKRLAVRRKLQQLGKQLLPEFVKSGLPLVTKTSLHHPYVHNSFRVQSQWLYFSRLKKDLKPLKEIMGPSFEELDSHYTHTLLVVGIDYEGMFISLKIHEKAWWDGQNLKNKCADQSMCTQLREILKPLKDFSLSIHDWKKRYPCSEISNANLTTFFRYYIPGNHWLHLDYRISREACGVDIAELATQHLLSLCPVYRFIVWDPENNYIFKKKSEKQK